MRLEAFQEHPDVTDDKLVEGDVMLDAVDAFSSQAKSPDP